MIDSPALRSAEEAFVSSSELEKVKLIAFRSANLPLFVGQEKGIFAQNGLEVDLTYTRNSVEQIRGILAGKWDLCHTAADNVLAYVEEENADLFMFMGVARGSLSLYARPEIARIADLKGKKLGVDAVTTGYAFVLQKILKANGVLPGDYELVSVGNTQLRYEALKKGDVFAALLTPPENGRAEGEGLKLLAISEQYLPDYQGSVGSTTRAWAASHEETLVRYIRAYRQSLDWIFKQENREEGAVLLARRGELPPDIARRTMEESILDPRFGIIPDAKLNTKGLATVIALRGEMGFLKPPLPGVEKFYDPCYFEKAVSAGA